MLSSLLRRSFSTSVSQSAPVSPGSKAALSAFVVGYSVVFGGALKLHTRLFLQEAQTSTKAPRFIGSQSLTSEELAMAFRLAGAL